MSITRSIFCAAVGCLLATTAQAQQAGTTWSNRVSRMVYTGDTSAKDTTLARIITEMALAGKVTVYSTFDSRFTSRVTPAQLKERLMPVDTITVEDPVTGKTYNRIVTHMVGYEYVIGFRVLEEWTFDTEKAGSHIQIVGLAPIRNLYGDDGKLRGPSAMYWVKYEDVKQVVELYDRAHPAKALSKAIWQSYTDSSTK